MTFKSSCLLALQTWHQLQKLDGQILAPVPSHIYPTPFRNQEACKANVSRWRTRSDALIGARNSAVGKYRRSTGDLNHKARAD